MILVCGATGSLGFEICRVLAEKGKNIRALVRTTSDIEKIDSLKGLGAEIVYGDLKNIESLVSACAGADVVISTVSAIRTMQEGDSFESVDRQGQLDLIEAAKQQSISHFIYISFPDTGSDFPLQNAKRDVEKALVNSGIGYTILQPTNFMEVWLSPALGFDPAGARATVYGSGNSKLSWISYKDVAKFAVAAIDSEAARDRSLKLGGPEALSYAEVISIFESAAGRSFTVQNIPKEALQNQMTAATNDHERSFAGLMLATAEGNEIEMFRTAQDFGIELTSVSDFARSVSLPDGPAESSIDQ